MAESDSAEIKTVIAFQIPEGETERHIFEFQMPPRSVLKEYLNTNKKPYCVTQTKLPTGRFANVEHKLCFYISSKDGIGIEFRFSRSTPLSLIKATYEFHFMSNGISKGNIKGRMTVKLGDYIYEKWDGPWETLSTLKKSNWDDSIDTIRLVFDIKLGVEWTKISRFNEAVTQEAGVSSTEVIESSTTTSMEVIESSTTTSMEVIESSTTTSMEVIESSTTTSMEVVDSTSHSQETVVSTSGGIGDGDMENSINGNVTDFFMSFSDVQLVCGNQNFPAHRLILSCKSSVFKSMFEESLEGRIVIDDLQPEVLKEMLRYIYTGCSDISSVYALDLFEAAEKYKLEDLISQCIISVEKGLEIYAAQPGISVPAKRFGSKQQ